MMKPVKRLVRLKPTLKAPPVTRLREKKRIEELRASDPIGYENTVKHLRKAYDNIMGKCYSPSNREYKNYGARGIDFAWKGDPGGFIRDVIEECGLRPRQQHSVDRWPDNNSGYKPGNIRWATKAEQAANRRSTKAVNIDGVEVSRPALACAAGLRPATLGARIRRQTARIDPYVLAFETNWNDRVTNRYDRPSVFFSDEQKLEVMKARARLPKELDLIEVSNAVLLNWPEFTDEAERADGMFNEPPALPRVEFFVRHLETAVLFWHRKQKAKLKHQEQRSRRHQNVRDYLKWRNELALEGMDPGDPGMYHYEYEDFDWDLYEVLKQEYEFCEVRFTPECPKKLDTKRAVRYTRQ